MHGVNAESTKSEWMKHIKYSANQIQTLPTKQLHRVGLMVKYEPALAERGLRYCVESFICGSFITSPATYYSSKKTDLYIYAWKIFKKVASYCAS